jgi:hypothetical protein
MVDLYKYAADRDVFPLMASCFIAHAVFQQLLFSRLTASLKIKASCASWGPQFAPHVLWRRGGGVGTQTQNQRSCETSANEKLTNLGIAINALARLALTQSQNLKRNRETLTQSRNKHKRLNLGQAIKRNGHHRGLCTDTT